MKEPIPSYDRSQGPVDAIPAAVILNALPEPAVSPGEGELAGREVVACAFCGGKVTLEDAIDLGWIPSFWDGAQEVRRPACGACAAEHLIDDEGATTLKPGRAAWLGMAVLGRVDDALTPRLGPTTVARDDRGGGYWSERRGEWMYLGELDQAVQSLTFRGRPEGDTRNAAQLAQVLTAMDKGRLERG